VSRRRTIFDPKGQDVSGPPGWNFDNTYARLPAALFSPAQPARFRAPRVSILNHRLAEELGVSCGDTSDAATAAVFAGQALPAGAEPIAQADAPSTPTTAEVPGAGGETPVAAPAAAPMVDPSVDNPLGGLPTRPVMRAGLWSSKLVTRTDKGKPVIEETQHCVPSVLDRGGVSIPKMETWSICGSSYRTDVVSTPEGFDMTLRCEASSTHYMIADLDFDRTGPVIESRSRYMGDFAARFSVHHQTEVRQASGRRRSIDSKSEFVRIDDCPRDVGAVPPVSAEAVAEAEAPVPALSLWRSVVDRHTTSGFGAEDDPAVAAAVAGVLADTRVMVMCLPEPKQPSLSEVFGPSDSGRGLRSARTEGRESEQRLSLFGYRVRLHSPWATLVADNGFVMNLTRTVRLHTSADRYVDERWSDSQPLRAGRLNDASKTTMHWVTTYERLGSCPPGMPIGILMKDPAAPPKSAPAP
jgi:hypothetical protein